MFSTAKEENARETYSRVLTYFLLVAMFVALALSTLSLEVIAVMSTPPFYDAYKVVPLIALSYVLYGCYFVLSVGIALEGKTKYAALIVVSAAILNLGLNYLLIPSYGMMGAAVATAICYAMLPIGMFFASRRYYPIQYEYARIAKILLACGIIYTGSIYIVNESAIVEGLLRIAALFTYPILLYFFGFYKAEEIEKGRELPGAAYRYVRLKLREKGVLPWRK